MSVENENELWDLLNEPIESNQKKEPAPVKKERPRGAYAKKPEPKANPLPKILGAAGWVVALGLGAALVLGGGGEEAKNPNAGLSMGVSQEQTEDTGLQTLMEELMAENESLTQENQELSAQLEDLTNVMSQFMEDIEYLESDSARPVMPDEEAQKKLEIHEHLILAYYSLLNKDAEGLETELEAVDGMSEYLDSDLLDAYYLILEYMEQPSWGLQ